MFECLFTFEHYFGILAYRYIPQITDQVGIKPGTLCQIRKCTHQYAKDPLLGMKLKKSRRGCGFDIRPLGNSWDINIFTIYIFKRTEITYGVYFYFYFYFQNDSNNNHDYFKCSGYFYNCLVGNVIFGYRSLINNPYYKIVQSIRPSIPVCHRVITFTVMSQNARNLVQRYISSLVRCSQISILRK